MKQKHYIALAVILASIAISGAKRKTALKLDYRQKASWHYSLHYRSDCVIVDKDSTSKIRTSVFCALEASPKGKGDRLTFTVDSVSVESQFYNDEKQKSIAEKLDGGSFGVALIDGCPVVDTLTTFSVSEISEWDMVIQFAKLLPDIPVGPVRKGIKWERSGVFPLMTNIGKVDCEVYRAYRLDSLSSDGQRAHISWRFRYAALTRGVPKSQMMKRVPVSGKGRGRAAFDIKGKFLLRALVQFKTPVANYGDTQVHWLETTSLEYLPEPADTSGSENPGEKK